MASNTLKRASSANRSISPPPTRRKITTNSAVSNFFKPVSQKEPPKVQFNVVRDSLLTASYDGAAKLARPKPVKIAAFDLDDTIIKTKSGLRFARDEHDWAWWHASVPDKMQQLAAQGFTIIFISNQAGLSLRAGSKTAKGDMKSVNKFKTKVSAVLNALNLPICVYAATEKDLFRKPRTGMWDHMRREYGLEDPGDVQLESCFFVGDAGGRADDTALKLRKDHSCSDRDFAANAGISYHTPEEFFLSQEPRPFARLFDPLTFVQNLAVTGTDEPAPVFDKNSQRELVLFCGSPGAGKSTFYWQTMQPLGYERVNQDLLKTKAKCLKVAAQHLEEGTSVVVDNTNADIDTRAEWINLAQRLSIPIRLVLFTAPAALCEHNDAVRSFSAGLMNPEERSILPKMAFSGFASRYTEPTLQEGFEDITKVDFSFRGTTEQKALWTRYWIS